MCSESGKRVRSAVSSLEGPRSGEDPTIVQILTEEAVFTDQSAGLLYPPNSRST